MPLNYDKMVKLYDGRPDAKLIDSTGIFYQNWIEELDRTVKPQLMYVSYLRDMPIKPVSVGSGSSSFILGKATGNTTKKGFIAPGSNQIPEVGVTTGKYELKLHEWGLQISNNIFEIAMAQRAGIALEDEQYKSLLRHWHLDVDATAYTGDGDLGFPGLLTYAAATGSTNNGVSLPSGYPSTSASYVQSSTSWASATPVQILTDINNLCKTVHLASAYDMAPTVLGVGASALAALAQPMTAAGYTSVAEYVKKNAYSTTVNGKELEIRLMKHAMDVAGVNGATVTVPASGFNSRVIAYFPDFDHIRMPLSTLEHGPVEYRSLQQSVSYYAKVGQPEFIYPERVGYLDHNA